MKTRMMTVFAMMLVGGCGSTDSPAAPSCLETVQVTGCAAEPCSEGQGCTFEMGEASSSIPGTCHAASCCSTWPASFEVCHAPSDLRCESRACSPNQAENETCALADGSQGVCWHLDCCTWYPGDS